MKRSRCHEEDELSNTRRSRLSSPISWHGEDQKMKRSRCHDEGELLKTKRLRPSYPSCHDQEKLRKMKRSRQSSPGCDREDELPKTKRSRPSYYSQRYHYECELSEDDNSIVVDPLPQSTVMDLVSTVRINLRVNYMLRFSGGYVDETLDSIQRCFYMRLYVITGLQDYLRRLYSWEFCQVTGDMLYDVNEPEGFLQRFLGYLGVVPPDVNDNLIEEIKDFVNRKRACNSSSNRVLPIAVSVKIYTLQQKDETIEDAKRRAITTDLSRIDRANQLIKLLERPPPYKFMIEFNDDHEMLGGDCCICLSKLSVGEEVLFLSCSHIYHYDCLISWRQKGKQKGTQCPLCRCPMNLRKFIASLIVRHDNLSSGDLQMETNRGGECANPQHTLESLQRLTIF